MEDLDVLVRPTSENAARVFAALAAFGAPVGPHGVDRNTFGTEGPAYRIGMTPLRIVILTKISGVSFGDASTAPLHTTVDGRDVAVFGREAPSGRGGDGFRR